MAALPAYMRIRQYVNDLMMEHAESNVRIMSERELCEKFAVTRPTARRALKELIDEGCLCAKPGLGTFINSAKVMNHSFALRKSFKVTVIFGNGRYSDLDGFHMNILARICDNLKYLPIRLRMANLNQSDRTMALDELRMYNPDGIIWIRPDLASQEVIAAIRPQIPVYTIGDVADGTPGHVSMDYYQCGRLAAAWLLDRGHKKSAFVGYTPEMPVKVELYRGWEDEFASRGLSPDKHLRIDMNSNIVTQVKNLLSANAIEGLFSFGSEYAAVDMALADFKTYDCPVIVDENYYGFYGTQTPPAAKLIMFLQEEADLATENLFKTLNNPGYMSAETILQPKIENIRNK